MNRQLTKSELRAGKPDRRSFATRPRHPIVLVLDNLKVAYNVGVLLRLADALLIDAVYLCGSTICPPNEKIRSASRGAERWVPWVHRPNTRQTVLDLKASGHFVVALEVCDASRPYHALTTVTWPIAVVLGREYDGVSPDVLALSDAVVDLPMYGMANSINVAASAAVVLYHLDHIYQAKLNTDEARG